MSILKNKKFLFSILVVIILIASYLLKGTDENKMAYDEITIKSGTLNKTISTTGAVTPKNRLELKPSVAGRVEKLLVKEGDFVKKGQIIGWISSSERVALIDAARASGKKELERWEKIYKATPLIAAIDGTLISRDIEPGQTVTLQDPVVVIADKLIIRAIVDETDIAKVTLERPTIITLDAYPSKQHKGTVSHIAYEATIAENVTVYEVDIQLNSIPEYMKSGMSADVLFLVESKENIPFVLATTVQYDSEGAFLYVKGEADTPPIKKRIKLGIQDGTKIEILNGSKSGDVVLSPSINLGKNKSAKKSNPFMPTPPNRKKSKHKNNESKK